MGLRGIARRVLERHEAITNNPNTSEKNSRHRAFYTYGRAFDYTVVDATIINS